MIELKNCLIKYFDELIIRLCGQFTFNAALYSRYRLESVKRQFFVFQMCWRIYSFVIDLQILMKVILDHVLNCLLMMQVILFPHILITLLAYLHAIIFLLRIYSYCVLRQIWGIFLRMICIILDMIQNRIDVCIFWLQNNHVSLLLNYLKFGWEFQLTKLFLFLMIF